MTQYDYVNWLDDIINYYESNDVDIDRSFLIRIIERMADSANISFDEMIDILSQSEANEEFREEDHPRDSDGKFTSKGGAIDTSEYKKEIDKHKKDIDEYNYAKSRIKRLLKYTKQSSDSTPEKIKKYEERIKEHEERIKKSEKKIKKLESKISYNYEELYNKKQRKDHEKLLNLKEGDVKLTSQHYQGNGDQKEMIGKCWLLPDGRVAGRNLKWHDNMLRDAKASCAGCYKVRADIKGGFLEISDIDSDPEKNPFQLDKLINYIKVNRLTSDDVGYGGGTWRDDLQKLLKPHYANRSNFAKMIALRNAQGESYSKEEFKEEDHPRDSDGKFTSKGSGSSVVLEDEIKDHVPEGEIVGNVTIKDPFNIGNEFTIEWGDMEDDEDAVDDFRDKNNLWRELELNPKNDRDQEMTVEGEMLEEAMKQWGETDYPNGSVYLTRDGTWVGGKSIYGYDEDHRPQIRKGLTYAGIKIEHTERTAYSDSSSQDLTDGLNISGMIRARASPNEGLNLDISHPITSSQRRAIQDFMIENDLSQFDLVVDLGNKMKDKNEDTISRSLSYESYSKEEFREEDHPRDEDGKFTSKGGGDVKSYKDNKLKEVEPNKEIQEKQKKIDMNVTNKVEDAIKELGIEDKIYDVAMQGSYEKGTDLPSSGSDMDLFVVFNTDVSQEEIDKYGLEIGRKVLTKDFIESHGWNFDYSEEITATSKYVQAFFKDGDQSVEVQIVPTRHLTLEQIKEKKLNGKDINIGMERTPHQTEYMKDALKGKEGEVRVLKKFMKDAGLYGSNLKEMGFSGYSAEVLVDKFGSFEDVIDFIADLKEGDMVDKQGGGKRNQENVFSIIDPIDPNRDLVSAFSTQKIGKAINVAKHFKETGKIPETEYREMDSATITFESDEMNEDTLSGQVRKLAKSYQKQLGKMGFEINTREESINGIKVEVPDFSFDSEWDNDKQKNIVKINLGSDNITIPKEYKDKGVDLDREKAVSGYKKANSGLKFVEEDGKLKAIKEREFTDMSDAINYLMNMEGKIVKSNQNEYIKNTGRVSTGRLKLENL
jgi:tRNA nucleotidyltransferase (CCA-adding enzyme)